MKALTAVGLERGRCGHGFQGHSPNTNCVERGYSASGIREHIRNTMLAIFVNKYICKIQVPTPYVFIGRPARYVLLLREDPLQRASILATRANRATYGFDLEPTIDRPNIGHANWPEHAHNKSNNRTGDL